MKVGSYNYTLPGGRQQQGTLALLLRPSGLGLLALFFSLGFCTKTLLVERDEIAERSAHRQPKTLPRHTPHGTVAGLRGPENKHDHEEAASEPAASSSASSVGRFITNVAETPPTPINPLTQQALTPKKYIFSPPESESIFAWPHQNDWAASEETAEWWQVLRGWEQETQIAYRTFLQRAAKKKNGKAVVVDFGSWIGPTVLLSALNNAGGRVIGIEPDRQAFSEAYHNIKLNAEGKNKGVVANTIELYHLCISDKEGELEMFGAPGDSMSTLMPTENDKNKKGYTSWKVECQTLDGFLSDGAPKSNIVPVSEGGTFVPVDPADIAFVKIDTEGHEKALLPSLKPWLAKHKPTILLSMHVFMYEGPEHIKDHDAVLEVIKLYRYALLPDGRNANDPKHNFTLVGWCRLCTLLLTDEEVPEGFADWTEVFKKPVMPSPEDQTPTTSAAAADAK